MSRETALDKIIQLLIGYSPMEQEVHQCAGQESVEVQSGYKTRKARQGTNDPLDTNVPVDTAAIANVEVIDVDFGSADKDIMASHDARHGGKEDTIAGEDSQESCSRVHKAPRIDDRTQNSNNVCTSAEVDVLRKDRCQIQTSGERIAWKVASQLRYSQGESSKKHCSSCSRAVIGNKQANEQGGRIPDRFAQTVWCGRGNEDADHGGEDAVHREGQSLSPDGMARARSEPSVVILIEYTRRNGTDG
ncbi:hypothetical protein HBI40_040820 [Parastagonospora nodorum]|nr:hypothetical protein HBI74_132340 [Parastagonospora nodorum]KAH5217626.1 hypothetical protein HBH77_052920 [Parastagonospora nodorum]KAH5425600.1 hypothetical protein HBI46_054250 [Parastagonospora nodorum]KAH5743212.1 hypothetical protein HBI18_033450 [Parastagonospora nodorum]KAH6299659.1 hypothetical protein HBI40_040820 [Parastagonospora nodorum]